MIIACKDCKEEFECRTHALRCHICRPIAARKQQKAYIIKYAKENSALLKKRQASYHTDAALGSGYF